MQKLRYPTQADGLNGHSVIRLFLRFLIGLLEIERSGGADEVFQGGFIDGLAFADVDGTPDIAFEAGVEETGWVGQCGPLRKGQFDGVFVGLPGADNTGVGEDGRSRAGGLDPLPLFDDLGVCFVDKFADFCEGMAAPVA